MLITSHSVPLHHNFMSWIAKLKNRLADVFSINKQSRPTLKPLDVSTDPEALAFFAQFNYGKPERARLYQKRAELDLPPLLYKLIETNQWVHPGDTQLRNKIPFIREPVAFLNFKGHMLPESGPLMEIDKSEDRFFSEYKGSIYGYRDLPWIDIEKTIFIIINKIPGDDLGIALDYRLDVNNPRVVASDWQSGEGVKYIEICPSFESFVTLLEL